MTHVKVTNKDTGVPQVLTKANFRNIQENQPSLAKNLEYMHDCDENGRSENEVRERQSAAAEEAKKIPNPDANPEMEDVKKKLQAEQDEVKRLKEELENSKKNKTDDGKKDKKTKTGDNGGTTKDSTVKQGEGNGA